MPSAIDTGSRLAISESESIRSRNAVSDAVCRGFSRRRSMAVTIFCHKEFDSTSDCSPTSSGGPSSSGMPLTFNCSSASITPLPIPRVGTLMMRRSAMSSRGLRISLR